MFAFHTFNSSGNIFSLKVEIFEKKFLIIMKILKINFFSMIILQFFFVSIKLSSVVENATHLFVFTLKNLLGLEMLPRFRNTIFCPNSVQSYQLSLANSLAAFGLFPRERGITV